MKSIISKGFLAILICSSLTFVSCEKSPSIDQPGDPVNITTEVYQKEVIDSANRFAFDLFRPDLAGSKGSENIMISPFSITSALSMTLNGAAGETFDAIKKTLGLDDKTLEEINKTYLKLMTEMVPVDSRVTLEIANSVWVEKKFTVKQPFINALQTWYKAEALSIDASDPHAVDIVNGWIADKTHDRIQNMMDNLDPNLAMLLINAIYFNGKWRYGFDKANTLDEPFYVTPDSPKSVPMMHLTENLKAVKYNNLTIAEIPYGQGNFTMVVVLPDENVSCTEIANELTPSLWQQWIDLLDYNTHNVDLSMPRFKYEYKRLLNDDLIGLGMGIAFSDFADFSNISDQSIVITRVLHQSFIENNEEGTEAAAATVVEFSTTSVNPTPQVVSVTLDHPFLYFIRETSTGTILFMGRVSNPTLN
jgi:serine protease inhibitor